MISTIGYDQHEIISNIITLHVPTGRIQLDPTYSKGNFYKGGIQTPEYISDLYPTSDLVERCDAADTPYSTNELTSIMFDPPFIAGHTKDKPTGIIGERFHGFRYIKDLWEWYDLCLAEFYRILGKDGVLIFKCQDTVSSGKQWLSHVHIIKEAETLGFYTKDLFVLLATHRMHGHNHGRQLHARKFHSYFLVFTKRNNTVIPNKRTRRKIDDVKL